METLARKRTITQFDVKEKNRMSQTTDFFTTCFKPAWLASRARDNCSEMLFTFIKSVCFFFQEISLMLSLSCLIYSATNT